MVSGWQVLRRLLPAGGWAMPQLGAGVKAPLSESTAAAQQWHVLVYDSYESQPQPTLASEVDPEGISVFEKSKWRTVWSNGQGAKVFDGLLTNIGRHLYRLETRTIAHLKDHYCREGLICCKYSVDVLDAVPFGKGKRKQLWRPRSTKFTDFCNCQSYPENDRRAPQPTVSETCAISIRSIFNECISIDCVGDEYAIASLASERSRSWKTFQMAEKGLTRVGASKTVVAQAQQAYAARAAASALVDEYDDPDEDYLLMPNRGGIAIEFGCTLRDDPGDKNLYRIRLDDGEALPESLSRSRDLFMQENPDLIEWSETEFYSVAPDQSAVVYLEDGTLYWKNKAGFKRALGQVSTLRGFQWINTRRLSTSELYSLMAH